MATATQPSPTPSVPDQETSAARPRATTRLERPYRLSVEQYERMGRLGIVGEKERVFLWKGLLVEKMTINPPHAIAVASLTMLLPRLLPEGWHIRQDLPIRLGEDSMPEPDLVVVRGEVRRFLERHPSASDIALVIEVSDTSLAVDRGEVLQEYARAGILVYWIVNIPQRCIEVYTDPTGPSDAPTFRALRTFVPGEAAPIVLDGREVGRVALEDILP